MNRREFLVAGAASSLTPALMAACGETCGCGVFPKLVPPARPAQLNLCLQWGGIPVQNDVNAKLDYLAQNGYKAVETPSGLDWLKTNGLAVAEGAVKRGLFVATACGPSRFDYADPAKCDAEVAKFLPVLEILGAMKSVGLIICPARGKPEVGLKELRASFVEKHGRALAEKAAACGTSIVLEPLQRAETPFLRQVSDGARMAQEIGAGCTVMGDFWHMSKEEASFFGAFVTAGKLLSHVHIASLGGRKVPGVDGDKDDYVDGLRGLKFIGYRGAISFEGGFPAKGKDAKGKPIMPNAEERHVYLQKMCALIREQWAQA